MKHRLRAYLLYKGYRTQSTDPIHLFSCADLAALGFTVLQPYQSRVHSGKVMRLILAPSFTGCYSIFILVIPATRVIIMANTRWKSVYRSSLFDGKVCLVTGGGTGIGRAIATELASLGAAVVISSRDVEKCTVAAKEMNEYIQKHSCSTTGKVVVGPSTSIRDEDQVNNLIEHIIDTYKVE